jgi:lysozyme
MERITTASNNLLKLVEKFEGLFLNPYLCPAGVPTIGLGSTYYENGKRVGLNDPAITKERAYELFKHTLKQYEKDVDTFTRDDINQNQFDALVDFAYNCGSGNLKTSTLLKKVNLLPNDPLIAEEFKKWNKGGGKVLNGLVKRRQAELELYFKII